MAHVPARGEAEGEILEYFRRAGGGDEFRSNREVMDRWFKPDGTVDAEKVKAAPDVHALVAPSRARALMLNKAYMTVVHDQDYIHGRNATDVPSHNVYQSVGADAPVLPPEKFHVHDIRLAW
jgi:hypothetical protein